MTRTTYAARPRPLPPLSPGSVGRAGALSMSPQPGGGHHFISATEGGRNGDKRGSAASGSDSRNIKNSNDGGARMSRWFSWEMPEISAGVLSELRLSLRARVRVAFADREIDVEGAEEWRELFV